MLLAETNTSKRVLETASPPTFYLPPEALQTDLEPVDGSSFASGRARPSTLSTLIADWPVLLQTHPGLCGVEGWLSFYPAECQCYVAGQRVRAQAGGSMGVDYRRNRGSLQG